MKKLMYILSAVVLSVLFSVQTLQAQTKHLTKKEQRKLEKQKKKEAKYKEIKASKAKVYQMLKNKHFVFEAQKVYLPGGPYTTLDYSLNFLAVKDDRIVIQLHFPGLNGPNGLGGVTARGKLENWLIDPGKKLTDNITASGQVTPKGSSGRVVFTLFVGYDGSAELQVNLPNSSFRLTGNVVSLEKANVIVGESAF